MFRVNLIQTNKYIYIPRFRFLYILFWIGKTSAIFNERQANRLLKFISMHFLLPSHLHITSTCYFKIFSCIPYLQCFPIITVPFSSSFTHFLLYSTFNYLQSFYPIYGTLLTA